MELRCLIVDDNASFLEEAAALMRREGFEVAGVASTVDDALQQTSELHPDLVLVDISLGTESGFDFARRLAESNGHAPRVIVVSTHSEADFADLIDDAPVVGFLAKSELSGDAIRRMLS